MINEVITYPPLIPALTVNNAVEAIAFYKVAFGATESYRLVDPESGKIGYAELLLNGSIISLSDEYSGFDLNPRALGGTSVRLILMVDDVDASVERANAAGAEVVKQPSDQFHGHRSATICDPFGHKWMFVKQIEKVTPEEMQRRWDKMVEKI
jgi:PhnB protein